MSSNAKHTRPRSRHVSLTSRAAGALAWIACCVGSAALFPYASACTDPGVIGSQPACAAPCTGGLTCNLDLQSCVECAVAEDCPSDEPYCEGFACAECRDGADCEDDEMCAGGACVQCVVDDDCEQSLGSAEVHVCEGGYCVDEHIEEEEEESEEEQPEE